MIRYFYLFIIPLALYSFKVVAQTPPPPPAPSANPEVLNTPPPPPDDPEVLNTPPPPPGGISGEAPTVSADEPRSPEELLLEQGDFSKALEMGKDILVSEYKLRAENTTRDPFTSVSLQRGIASDGTVDITEFLDPRMPLENFPIDQLKLTGVLWRTATPKASFLDPTGSAHIARKNERIGINKGYIAAIREGEVIVIEPVAGGDSSYQTRIIRINGEDNTGEVQGQEGGNL